MLAPTSGLGIRRGKAQLPRPRHTIATSPSQVAPSLVPNGSRFAYIRNRSGADEIWLRDRQDHSERLIVGIGGSREDAPALPDTAISPEGRRVA
jgi:Tol biopolymer transport system component